MASALSPAENFPHLVADFAQEVQIMSDFDEGEKVGVGDLVKELVLAMQSQARTKPHPLLYVNLGFLLALAFWMGVSWQRVNEMDNKVHAFAGTEVISAQVSSLQNEVSRLRDRLDTLIDRQQNGKK